MAYYCNTEYRDNYRNFSCGPDTACLPTFGKKDNIGYAEPDYQYKEHGLGIIPFCDKCPQDTHGCTHQASFCRNASLLSKSNREYWKSSDVIGSTVTKRCTYKDVKKRQPASQPDDVIFFPGHPRKQCGRSGGCAPG